MQVHENRGAQLVYSNEDVYMNTVGLQETISGKARRADKPHRNIKKDRIMVKEVEIVSNVIGERKRG